MASTYNKEEYAEEQKKKLAEAADGTLRHEP